MKQIAALIDQVKVRDTEMKHLVKAARDGAKGSCTPVASFEPFDLNSELWLDYLKGLKTFLTGISIPKKGSSSVFINKSLKRQPWADAVTVVCRGRLVYNNFY